MWFSLEGERCINLVSDYHFWYTRYKDQYGLIFLLLFLRLFWYFCACDCLYLMFVVTCLFKYHLSYLVRPFIFRNSLPDSSNFFFSMYFRSKDSTRILLRLTIFINFFLDMFLLNFLAIKTWRTLKLLSLKVFVKL